MTITQERALWIEQQLKEFLAMISTEERQFSMLVILVDMLRQGFNLEGVFNNLRINVENLKKQNQRKNNKGD